MTEQHPFKWRHFQADIILLCVRWYLRYSLSYRDLEEMMRERKLHVDHTTIYRWVQQYAPELERRCRPHLKPTMDSWRFDETYIKVKKEWMYLYRAVDSQGNTLEFFFSPIRDAKAAKRFFLKTLMASQSSKPRVINVDTNAAYPKAFRELKADGVLPEGCELAASEVSQQSGRARPSFSQTSGQTRTRASFHMNGKPIFTNCPSEAKQTSVVCSLSSKRCSDMIEVTKCHFLY